MFERPTNKPSWYSAWRMAETNEPYIMVYSTFPVLLSKIMTVICDTGLVNKHIPVRRAHISAEEWDTWLAFDLCPAIEIYYDSKHTLNAYGLQWRRITS